jgi:hypothetical protein
MTAITSKRLDRNEMMQLLDMLNVTQSLLTKADETGESTVSVFTVRKTRLEGLYTLTISAWA